MQASDGTEDERIVVELRPSDEAKPSLDTWTSLYTVALKVAGAIALLERDTAPSKGSTAALPCEKEGGPLKKPAHGDFAAESTSTLFV
jgi:hypothetical protein